MLIWMAIKRRPFVVGRGGIPDGSRGADLEAKHPGSAHWPAHNYQHLMEQPTIFYAIVLSLVLMDSTTPSTFIWHGLMWVCESSTASFRRR